MIQAEFEFVSSPNLMPQSLALQNKQSTLPSPATSNDSTQPTQYLTAQLSSESPSRTFLSARELTFNLPLSIS